MSMRYIKSSPAFFSILFAAACAQQTSHTDVLMKFHTIQRIPGSQSVAVILTEASGSSFLSLSVDEGQALSIYLGQKHIPSERPLSHDLMANLLKRLNAEVRRIVITDLRENVYYAEIELIRDNEKVVVDARPSDAIALALRVDAPIYARSHLLERFRQTSERTGEISPTQVGALGLSVQPLEGTLQRVFGSDRGVLITQVEPESPAAAAQLAPGDLILMVDTARVPDIRTLLDLLAEKAGENALRFEISRGDSMFTVTVSRQN